MVLGALATRDWRPMHHDKDFAVNRNGTQDIFLNTPNQAAWFERYLTDWTGPHGRLGRVTFRMKGSVFPGDTMILRGVVVSTEVDEAGCGFVTVDVTLSVEGDVEDNVRRPDRPASVVRRQPMGPPGRPVATLTGGPHEVAGFPYTITKVVLTCWTSSSTRSRSSCARPPATCWRVTARSTSSGPWRTTPSATRPSCGRSSGALDLIGLLLPEEYGGSGMSLVEGVALYEELGRALAPVPHFVSAVLGGGVLAAAGSAAQKERWLRAVASGEAILTPAWLEPENGFSPRGVEARATADGFGLRLDGVKRHVAFASAADRLVVLARTGEADDAVDLFLVDPTAVGVTLRQQFSVASDTQYEVTLRRRRRGRGGPHRCRRERLGHLAAGARARRWCSWARRPSGGRATRSRSRRSTRSTVASSTSRSGRSRRWPTTWPTP